MSISKNLKKIAYRLHWPIQLYKSYCDYKWQKRWEKYINECEDVNLIVGAAETNYPGWFPTDIQFVNPNEIQLNVFHFDITNASHFEKNLKGRKIDKILAEHVLEHLTNEQIDIMAKNFYDYSSKKIHIRIAVPDGFHQDPAYIQMVKPGGTGEGAHDHKQLFTYRSLSAFFEKQGFLAHPVEYWDENHQFIQNYQNDDKGHIKRSFVNDSRNQDGTPRYTSLIVDFTKH